ncbi:MAG: MFS transporter, partial [Gammaproteobacteria bacterium]
LVLPLVGATRPWQLVFYVLGGAGLVFAWLLLLIREPLRQGALGATAHAIALREVIATLSRHRRTVLMHNFGFACLSLASYSANAWQPSVWQRVHGWEIREVGLVYGGVIAISGGFGIVLGGWLADRWKMRGMSDATLRVGAIAAGCSVPLSLLMPFMPGGTALALLTIPMTIFIAMPFGVSASAIQDLVPNRMRGQTSAIYLFIVNLVGLGIGPTLVALFTDRVFEDDAQVHRSLGIVMAMAQVTGFVLLARGRVHYRASLEQIQGRS